ncbi:MAG: chemotaxis protein CheW [Caulobacteraceae bacterium]
MGASSPIPGGGSVLTFRVGAMRLAVSVSDVAEVLRAPRLTRVPHGPPALLGIASLRGRVAPVVSVARLLGAEEGGATAASRVIVLDLGIPLGLAVDEVLALSHLEDGAASAGALFISDEAAVRMIDLPALLRQAFATFSQPRVAERGEAAAAKSVTPARNETALMSFELAGQFYALPLSVVVEVMAIPAAINALPDIDAADVGVASVNGLMLPIVSGRALLGLAPMEKGVLERARVVTTRVGEATVGIAVDRLNAIIRVPDDAISPVPAILNRGGGEARVEGIARLADGRSIVSILSPEGLFRADSLAQILADGCRDADMIAQPLTDDRQTFIVFRLGDEHYGLPIACVDEVAHLPPVLTRVPRAPAFVEGVMNLRGKIVPVIDQSRRFGAADGSGKARRIIVTRSGGAQAGFIVDAVSEILQLRADQLSTAPALATAGDRVFDRVADLGDGRIVLLVDPQGLLDRAEADLLSAFERQRER